jgi:hypothetical protein
MFAASPLVLSSKAAMIGASAPSAAVLEDAPDELTGGCFSSGSSQHFVARSASEPDSELLQLLSSTTLGLQVYFM